MSEEAKKELRKLIEDVLEEKLEGLNVHKHASYDPVEHVKTCTDPECQIGDSMREAVHKKYPESCPECGYPVKKEEKECPNCKEELEDEVWVSL